MRGWKQRTGVVKQLDCRAGGSCTGGSVSDLMRPEIIPHSYMGNTLYDLCRLWRLTVSLANAPAALESRAQGQDLKFFLSICVECVIIFASFSLVPMMVYSIQITTSTVVNGYNWLWENHKRRQSQNSKFGNLESVYLFIYLFFQGMNRLMDEEGLTV